MPSKAELAARLGIDTMLPLTLSDGTPIPDTRDGDDNLSPGLQAERLAADAEAGTIGKTLQRRAGYGKVTPESLARYLEAYALCGICVKSALAAGLSYASIRAYRKKDAEFAELEEEAKQRWIARVIDEPFRKLTQLEVMDPLFNPKTGALLGHKHVIAPQIMLAFARKFDPSYREASQVDVNISGGVLVVSAPAMSVDDWRRKFVENEAVVPAQPAAP